MHYCIRDFTQAAPACILIGFHPQQSHCTVCILHEHRAYAFDIRAKVTRLTHTLWSRHRWQIREQIVEDSIVPVLSLASDNMSINNSLSTAWVCLLYDSVILYLSCLHGIQYVVSASLTDWWWSVNATKVLLWQLFQLVAPSGFHMRHVPLLCLICITCLICTSFWRTLEKCDEGREEKQDSSSDRKRGSEL